MDPRPEAAADESVVITGLGHVIVGRDDPCCDPMPYLGIKKLRKYMGVQDDLAVVAAGRALDSAGLAGTSLGGRTGLYLAVGYIPFEQRDIDPLFRESLDGDTFCMQRFSTAGFRAVSGLLTFRCLPNMPAFHISVSFNIQGPYFITYPGPGQFYLALEQACLALATETVDVALVSGVAHQRNFLVTHHFNRIDHPVPADRLLDAAGCLILERSGCASARRAPIRGRLVNHEIAYTPHDPFEESPVALEPFDASDNGEFEVPGEMGAASLPAALSLRAECGRRRVRHHVSGRDNLHGSSTWELI